MSQKSRRMDKMGIMEKVNENKTKANSVIFSILKEQIDSGLRFSGFRERRSSFSLDFPPFGPSVRFGPRSKDVLRGESYAWAPIL